MKESDKQFIEKMKKQKLSQKDAIELKYQMNSQKKLNQERRVKNVSQNMKELQKGRKKYINELKKRDKNHSDFLEQKKLDHEEKLRLKHEKENLRLINLKKN